jgi:catechol-2,3-dioxygenase
VFATRRYPEMLRWYQTVFDARVQIRSGAATFLAFDDEHHRFMIADLDAVIPGEGGKDRAGLIGVSHLAYSFACLRDLADHYERLKAAGILPFWVIHHGFTMSMYYGDPDCNDIEFQVDLFDGFEATTRYMQSGALAENPIGVEVDAEEFVARIRAGTPHEAFVSQPPGPVSPVRSSRTDPPIRPVSAPA